MRFRKPALILVTSLAGLAVLLALLVWAMTFHPAAVQEEAVACAPHVPTVRPGQVLRVLSWNVQFMAGKDYVFFYDLPDGSGPDERPSRRDIDATLAEVARVIAEENPDLLLLQEMDDGAARTDHEDQLARLLELLPSDYACHASAFYWKAAFVPHPRILGAVGMKLSTVSKYRITRAMRHQLTMIPSDPVKRQFSLKRAVLEVSVPVEGGAELAVFNTHLDAFAQGTDTMERQVFEVAGLLENADRAGGLWLAAGDFNLLPTSQAYERLQPEQRAYYLPESELEPLYARYGSVPGPAETGGSDFARWFTYFPNDPVVKGPDRTIDYIFFSDRLEPERKGIRRQDTLGISDHLPVTASFVLPR